MNKVPVMDEEPFCRCAMCRSALVKAATILGSGELGETCPKVQDDVCGSRCEPGFVSR